jgi:hypothetical protein
MNSLNKNKNKNLKKAYFNFVKNKLWKFIINTTKNNRKKGFSQT